MGIIVNSETTNKWNHTGLKSSYIGSINLNGADAVIEVLIFDRVLANPSIIGSITADILSKNGYARNIDFHQNLSVSCEKKQDCENFLKLLAEQSKLLEGQ